MTPRQRLWTGLAAFVSLLLTLALPAAAGATTPTGATPPGATHASATAKPAGVHALKGMPPVAGTIRPMATCGAGPCYHYVYGTQTITAPSISSSSYMANPFLKTASPADAHTLQEISAEDATGSQIVEVGWTKDNTVCGGTTTPCLFTYAWVNGVAKCYNGCGFTAVGTTYTAGQAIPSGDLGTVKNFQIIHGGTPSGWYVYYNGVSFGYWPDTVWSGASPPVTFTTGGYFQVFGEVAGFSTSIWPPCTDMGTGIQGSLGQSNVPKPSSWSSTSYGGVANTSVNLAVSDTYPTGYSHLTTGGPSNVRSFSLGGPGANSTGTGVGTTGSC